MNTFIVYPKQEPNKYLMKDYEINELVKAWRRENCRQYIRGFQHVRLLESNSIKTNRPRKDSWVSESKNLWVRRKKAQTDNTKNVDNSK